MGNATARLVSAWVTEEYRPRGEGSSYSRVVVLHFSNESHEPMFEGSVNVHIGLHATPVDPLAAFSPVSLIPSRRELSYDTSISLLAHEDSWNPRATLQFSDPPRRRWLRSLDGDLRGIRAQKMKRSKSQHDGDERQLGDQYPRFNPMLVAVLFLKLLREKYTTCERLSPRLAPEARGWGATDLRLPRDAFANFQQTSMVDYPAPRIARVKL